MLLVSSRFSTPKRALGIFLAAILCVTAIAPSAHAQQNQPPIADAGDDKVFPIGGVARILNGTRSFDIDGGGYGGLTFRWEVVTASYRGWLQITPIGSPSGSEATFIAPSTREVASSGNSITFRLTVTDSQGASHSDTVTYRFEDGPAASVSVAACLNDPNAIDADNDGTIEPEERCTLNALLGRPNQGGNSNIEWDVNEGAQLTVTAAGTPGQGAPANQRLTYRWRKISAVPNQPAFNVPSSQVNTKEFTVTMPTYRSDRGAIVHYSVTVTAPSGASTQVAVRINVVNQQAPPQVTLDVSNASQPVQDANASNPDSPVRRYIVAPGVSVQLTATATDFDDGHDRQLVYRWSSPDVSPSSSNPARGATSRAVFTAPSTAVQGQSFTVSATAIDPTDRSGTAEILFIVAKNSPPVVSVPANLPAEDGPRGGTDGEGVVKVPGTATDADGDSLVYRWAQTDAQGDPLEKPTVELMGADTDVVSFEAPRVPGLGQKEIYLSFTAIDVWGTSDTDSVTVIVLGRNERPNADAGPDQTADPETRIRLDGSATVDPDTGSSADIRTWRWDYTGFATVPSLSQKPISSFDRLTLAGFVPSGNDYSDFSGLNPFLAGQNTPVPYIDLPDLGSYSGLQLTFTLTVTDFAGATDTDTVTVNVVAKYFSGIVDGPDFCTNRSLGGARTYAFDSDKDGVADICSLPYTRREAVARQNALSQLAALDEARFTAQVLAACDRLTSEYGDSAASLASDACATRTVSPPPAPVAPALANQYYSGIISGPDFCASLSLGGSQTYPFDSDKDGVADICSLPYTRREAVARQNALEVFTTPQAAFDNAVSIACRNLAGTAFSDSAAALAADSCA